MVPAWIPFYWQSGWNGRASSFVIQVTYNKSSSAHSSVVLRHIEVLLDLALTIKKLVRLKAFRQGLRQRLIHLQVRHRTS